METYDRLDGIDAEEGSVECCHVFLQPVSSAGVGLVARSVSLRLGIKGMAKVLTVPLLLALGS